MKKNKFHTINIWFLVSAISILVMLIVITIFALRFLSAALFYSLSGISGGSDSASFDLEKARRLGL